MSRHKASPTLLRYVARTFAMRILLVLVTLLALLVVMDTVGESNRILAAPGAGEGDIWRYAGLRLPLLLAQFLPFTVLIATLITFSTFAATSQVIVMRALGLSPHQILAPMLAVAGLCGVFHFVWNESVAAPAAARLAVWQAAGYGTARAVAAEDAGATWITAPDGMIRARIAPREDGIMLSDVAIFARAAEGDLTKVTLAATGFLAEDGTGTLSNVRTIDLAVGDPRATAQMPWFPGVRPAHFLFRSGAAEERSFDELRRLIAAADDIGRDTRTLTAELYHKLARPFASFVMPLVGALVAFGLARTNTVLTRAAIALVLGFGYFMVDNMLMSMGRAGALPPLMAAWMAFVLFLLISESVLFRSEQ